MRRAGSAPRMGGIHMRIKKIAPALLLAVGLGIVSLTGCSPSAAPSGETSQSASAESTQESQAPETEEAAGDQSVAEACATAVQSVSDLQTDLMGVQSDATAGSFSAVAEKLGTLNERLQTAAAGVGNSEVATALGTLAEKVGEFAGLFSGIPDGDTAALGAKAAEIQTVSQEVAEAGQAMSTLCAG